MSHPSNISGLDSIRTTLIKRACLDDPSGEETYDVLLAKYYGPDWKKVFGVDVEEREEAEREKAEQVAPMTPYTGKSLRELDEEFFEKEKEKK